MGFTARWWMPQLKALLEGNHETVTQLNELTDLLWRIVGSVAAVFVFVYRLWRWRQKRGRKEAGDIGRR